MNHPNPEQWVSYVYGETSGAARRELSAHLRDCPQCQQEIVTWKRNLNRLDAWKLPRPARAQKTLFVPWLNWAAAAAIVLMAGILIGRATAPKVDPEKLRSAIAPEIRRQLSVEVDQLARQQAARAAALSLASGRSYTDQVAQQLYALIKKDIDTVAVNTDARLRHTAQQLVRYADYTQPETHLTQEQ
jgi:anti-sigma factor RsiW